MHRRIRRISNAAQAARRPRPRDAHAVVRSVKKPAPPGFGTLHESERQEPEAAVAALSLGAIAVIIMVWVVIKLLGCK